MARPRHSRPFCDWTGNAERLSFDVPTLPLFVHERLSTKAILQTLTGHERDRQMELQLFADPQLSLAQQLEAYEHCGDRVNRMILGDSLVVMNSVFEYEGLGARQRPVRRRGDDPDATRDECGWVLRGVVLRRRPRDGGVANVLTYRFAIGTNERSAAPT